MTEPRSEWHAALVCYPISGRCVVAWPGNADFAHYWNTRAGAVDAALAEVSEHEPHEDLKQARNLLMMNDRVRIGRIVVVIVTGLIPKVGVDGCESWTGVKIINDPKGEL